MLVSFWLLVLGAALAAVGAFALWLLATLLLMGRHPSDDNPWRRLALDAWGWVMGKPQ